MTQIRKTILKPHCSFTQHILMVIRKQAQPTLTAFNTYRHPVNKIKGTLCFTFMGHILYV